MKKIYHIEHDPAFASITVEHTSDATDISSLQGDAIKDFKQPVCRLTDSSKPLGNFIFLNDTALVFDDNTDLLMGDFIEYACQGDMYPLEVDGVGSLWLLNVVEVCNPLNKQESKWVPGAWQETLSMNKLVFHPKRVGSLSSLFKIPELDYKPILCFSGFSTDESYQEHDFYKFYHEHDFKGLVFNEIWSGE